MNCIISAWGMHEAELRGFLTQRLNNTVAVEDMLQDTFIRALEQGSKFCDIENPRAWLFRVARNLLVDSIRHDAKQNNASSLNQLMAENLGVEHTEENYLEIAVLESLDVCLPRALLALNTDDRKAIEACDLNGLSQKEFAKEEELSTAGAKSRVQRARKRLKIILSKLCAINFDDTGNICCLDPDGNSSCKI